MNLRIHRRTFLAGTLGGMLATTRVAVRAAPQPSHHLDAAQQQSVDWQAVAHALGATGQLMEGDVFRVSMPRSDLKVTAKGVPLAPAFALGSYAAFKQVGSGAMVMGDLVLLDAELNPVLSGLFRQGFAVTGIHNHLNELTPHVMYLHYMGMGDPVPLAQKLRQALSASATPLGASPPATPAAATPTTALPLAQLNQTLGRQGKVAKGGVVQFTVPRAETITENGLPLLPAMGVATVLTFQPLGPGQAAITGDVVMIAGEVNPVAQALRAAGIDVTALHNHHLGEMPRLFYMHFFATGAPVPLAQGLRAAVAKTNSKPG